MVQRRKIKNPVLFEGGHFYEAYGITEVSLKAFKIMQRKMGKRDKSILFVDNYHNFGDMLSMEKKSPLVDIDVEEYKSFFDFCVMEKDMIEPFILRKGSRMQEEIETSLLKIVMDRIDKVFKLEEIDNNKSLFGHRLVSNGKPTCLMLDLCLVQKKASLSFTEQVNVLPYFYEKEQRALKRIAAGIFPKVEISTILFGPNGSIRKI